jgi:hypothetical protein
MIVGIGKLADFAMTPDFAQLLGLKPTQSEMHSASF